MKAKSQILLVRTFLKWRSGLKHCQKSHQSQVSKKSFGMRPIQEVKPVSPMHPADKVDDYLETVTPSPLSALHSRASKTSLIETTQPKPRMKSPSSISQSPISLDLQYKMLVAKAVGD